MKLSSDWFKNKCSTLEPASSWLALVCACLIYSLLALPESVFGILYDGLIDRFETTRTTLAWASSLQWIFLFMSSLFISPLIEMFGCRRVALVCCVVYGTSMSLAAVSPGVATFYITYGILAGSGSGGLYLATTTVIQQLFTDNRGLANGIMPLGFSIGWIIHPLHTSGYFLEVYGLSGTLLLHGALCFHTAVFSMALKSPVQHNKVTPQPGQVQPEVKDQLPSVSASVDSVEPPQTNSQPQDEDQPQSQAEAHDTKSCFAVKEYFKGLLDFSTLKNRCFVLFLISNICFWFAKLGLYTHLVSCAIHRGLGDTEAAYLMSISGFGSTAARISASLLVNFSWVNVILFDCSVMLVICSSSLFAAYCRTYELFAVCATLLGIADALHTTNQPLLVLEILEDEQFPRGLAMMLTFTVPAPVGAPPFVGWLVDTLGTYRPPFLVLAVLCVLGAILTSAIFILMRIKSKSRPISTSESFSKKSSRSVSVTSMQGLIQ